MEPHIGAVQVHSKAADKTVANAKTERLLRRQSHTPKRVMIERRRGITPGELIVALRGDVGVGGRSPERTSAARFATADPSHPEFGNDRNGDGEGLDDQARPEDGREPEAG